MVPFGNPTGKNMIQGPDCASVTDFTEPYLHSKLLAKSHRNDTGGLPKMGEVPPHHPFHWDFPL